MKYTIQIIGCDDTMVFSLTLSEEEKKFLDLIAELSKDNKRYHCCPTIEVKEYDEND